MKSRNFPGVSEEVGWATAVAATPPLNQPLFTQNNKPRVRVDRRRKTNPDGPRDRAEAPRRRPSAPRPSSGSGGSGSSGGGGSYSPRPSSGGFSLPGGGGGKLSPLVIILIFISLVVFSDACSGYDGRAATVFGLEGLGGQGLVLDPGQRFRVDLTNELDIATLIHWHGQIPPNDQDGVPDLPRPMLMPGESRSYDYATMPGTYWMHAHIPLQEMKLLAAPLIVQSDQDMRADRQQVVMFLHDMSFKEPEEIMAEITGGHGGGHDMSNMSAAPEQGNDMGAMPGMDHSGMAMDGSFSPNHTNSSSLLRNKLIQRFIVS